MKKILLAALAALTLLAPAAQAIDALPASTKPRNQRVVAIFDDSSNLWTAGTILTNRRALDRSIGALLQKLEEQGCQVDYFNTGYFLKASNLTFTEATLWKNLGNTYALGIVMNAAAAGSKVAGAANTTRFYRADSTNLQLLVIPSGVNGGSFSDSTYGSCEVAGMSTNAVTSSAALYGQRCAFRPYGTTDTIYVNYVRVPAMTEGTTAAITSVVRLFEPLQLTPPLHPLMASADSTHVFMPAEGDTTASSTPGHHEMLGLGWRAYYSNGRWVDFYGGVQASVNNAFSDVNLGMVPYAMAARYLRLAPIKRAVEGDDMFDPDPNNTGRRWTNDGVDSLMTRWWTQYKCRILLDVNPLHGYEYIRGENPTYEMAWTGDPWTWPRKWKNPWVHHAHDSSAARPTSNLVGRFGGYQTGNGLGTTIGGHTVYQYHRMRAFAWQPGHNEPEKRYGIYQRLLYSDSLRRIACPECPVPPYLSFPDNAVLPVNWRMRNAAGNWASYRTVADSLCTPDSLFLALARGLRIPSGGTLYLRGYFYNGVGATGPAYLTRPWGYLSPKNFYGAGDTDSLISHTVFQYPGEERMVRDPNGASDVTGSGAPYWVRVKNVGALVNDVGPQYTMRLNSSSKLGRLFGFGFGAQEAGNTGAAYGAGGDYSGTAYVVDPFGIYGLNNTEFRPYTRDSPRIIYFHPSCNYTLGTGNGPAGPGDSQSTWWFERTILRPVRALNTIAGYDAFQWVWPWEVYNR